MKTTAVAPADNPPGPARPWPVSALFSTLACLWIAYALGPLLIIVASRSGVILFFATFYLLLFFFWGDENWVLMRLRKKLGLDGAKLKNAWWLTVGIVFPTILYYCVLFIKK